MAQLKLKVKKVVMVHPQTKQKGFASRVITNGKTAFDDICELAGLNTTLNVAELEAAGKLILQAAARELKNGHIIDMGPLGTLYPAVSSKWTETEDEQLKADLQLHVNYKPSNEIAAAIAQARLAWVNPEDEDTDSDGNTGDDGGSNNGDNAGNDNGGDDNGGDDNGGSNSNPERP